jgi:hypothetical protein
MVRTAEALWQPCVSTATGAQQALQPLWQVQHSCSIAGYFASHEALGPCIQSMIQEQFQIASLPAAQPAVLLGWHQVQGSWSCHSLQDQPPLLLCGALYLCMT